MNYADYAAASTHLILERHRLHQTLATQSAPRRATLVDVCAEAVARAPRNPSDAPRLQHLPEHLLARIVSFTPHVALRRPIDSIAQRDTAVWPEALRAAYTDAYVHALARDA